MKKTDIISVSAENAGGGFEALPVGKPAEDGTVTLTIKGLEDLDINYTLTSSILNSSAALSSESTVEENASDLDKYGLTNPQAKVTVKSNAETKTLLIETNPLKAVKHIVWLRVKIQFIWFPLQT